MHTLVLETTTFEAFEQLCQDGGIDNLAGFIHLPVACHPSSVLVTVSFRKAPVGFPDPQQRFGPVRCVSSDGERSGVGTGHRGRSTGHMRHKLD
jgi:hypothetical protein